MLIAIDPQRVPDEFVRSTVTLQTDRRMNALQVKVLSRTTLQQVIEEFDLYQEKRQRLTTEEVIAEMREDIGVVAGEHPRPRDGMRSADRLPPPLPLRRSQGRRPSDPAPRGAVRVAEHRGSRRGRRRHQPLPRDAAGRGARQARDAGAAARRTSGSGTARSCRRRPRPTSSRCRAPSCRRRAWSNRSPEIATASRCSSGCTTRRRASRRRRHRSRPRRQRRIGRFVGAGPARRRAGQPRCARAALQAGPPGCRRGPAAGRRARTAGRRRGAARPKPRAPDARAPVAVAVDATEQARRERVRSMAAEIESLDRQIAFKESEERRVRGEIAEYQRRLEAVPRLESAWIKLTRDYDTQQLAYRELLTKSTAAQVAANLEDQDIGERFRIVDPALVPVLPLAFEAHPLQRHRSGDWVCCSAWGSPRFSSSRTRASGRRPTSSTCWRFRSWPPFRTWRPPPRRHRSRKRRIVASVSGAACLAIAGYVVWSLQLWNSLH